MLTSRGRTGPAGRLRWRWCRHLGQIPLTASIYIIYIQLLKIYAIHSPPASKPEIIENQAVTVENVSNKLVKDLGHQLWTLIITTSSVILVLTRVTASHTDTEYVKSNHLKMLQEISLLNNIKSTKMFSSEKYKLQSLLSKLISGNECALAIFPNFRDFICLFLNKVNLAQN